MELRPSARRPEPQLPRTASSKLSSRSPLVDLCDHTQPGLVDPSCSPPRERWRGDHAPGTYAWESEGVQTCTQICTRFSARSRLIGNVLNSPLTMQLRVNTCDWIVGLY